ncbi:hypothetical protein [Helicobacter sp. T3_23-1056]
MGKIHKNPSLRDLRKQGESIYFCIATNRYAILAMTKNTKQRKDKK